MSWKKKHRERRWVIEAAGRGYIRAEYNGRQLAPQTVEHVMEASLFLTSRDAWDLASDCGEILRVNCAAVPVDYWPERWRVAK